MIDFTDGPVLLDMDVESPGIIVLGNHRVGMDDPGLFRQIAFAEVLDMTNSQFTVSRGGWDKVDDAIQSLKKALPKSSCRSACSSIPRTYLPSCS